MELLARIHRSDIPPSGFSEANETAQTLNDGVFVRLRKLGDGDFLIPKELRLINFTLYIQAEEKRNRSNGTVVCGTSGKPLVSRLRPAFDPVLVEAQAYFFAPISIVVVEGGWKSEDILIAEYRAVKEKEIAWMQERVIYAGDLGRLPSNIAHFKNAAQMAYKKGNCAGCRHIHFRQE